MTCFVNEGLLPEPHPSWLLPRTDGLSPALLSRSPRPSAPCHMLPLQQTWPTCQPFLPPPPPKLQPQSCLGPRCSCACQSCWPPFSPAPAVPITLIDGHVASTEWSVCECRWQVKPSPVQASTFLSFSDAHFFMFLTGGNVTSLLQASPLLTL